MSGQLYRPSNGSEGSDFESTYCGRCVRGAKRDCPILTAAFLYSLDDPEYPKEWVTPAGTFRFARCTAYEPTTPELAERYARWQKEHPL